jgi:WD40-like Beta Propeller Repeat
MAERRDLASPFSEPRVLEELESPLYEDSPRLAPDETIVLFGSLRAGGEGDHDVWYAVRPDRSVAFDEPRLVPTINSSNRDGEARLFHDGCGLYFVSDGPSDTGWDLYESRIVP